VFCASDRPLQLPCGLVMFDIYIISRMRDSQCLTDGVIHHIVSVFHFIDERLPEEFRTNARIIIIIIIVIIIIIIINFQ